MRRRQPQQKQGEESELAKLAAKPKYKICPECGARMKHSWWLTLGTFSASDSQPVRQRGRWADCPECQFSIRVP